MADRILYAITGLGHQAVVVFFVLSGYFIGTSVWESIDARRWSWRVYLVNRLTRLQLVLLPALILGGIWDQIGMRLPQAASFYYGGLYKYYAPSVALRSTVPVFFGNLFFLQSLAPLFLHRVLSPVFGSNGPLWSLSYEFWYYILFPALMLAAIAWKGMRGRLLYLGLAVVLFWFVGLTISVYFLIWLAGALVGRLRRIDGLRPSRALPVISVATGAFRLLWRSCGTVLTRSHRIRWRIAPSESSFAMWLYVLIHGIRQDVASAYARTAKTSLSGFFLYSCISRIFRSCCCFEV